MASCKGKPESYKSRRPKVGDIVPFRDVREGQWFTSGPADRRPWRRQGDRAYRLQGYSGTTAAFAADHYVKVVQAPRAARRWETPRDLFDAQPGSQ